jgi:hypothetical protein
MEGIFEELTQTLYHGSYTVVQKPDVTFGAPRKDFGQGFYTTTSKRQADEWAKASSWREKKPASTTSTFEFAGRQSNYGIYRFADDDIIGWIDFVAKNRYPNKYHPYISELYSNIDTYDIIIGPIANNTTFIIFRDLFDAVENGYSGELLKIEKQRAYERLQREDLVNQVFFRTQRAADALTFRGSYRVA